MTSAAKTVIVVATLMAVGILAGPASAATYTVNSTVEDIDREPGDGICAGGRTGLCTLRAAVEEANALAPSDTVNVPAGTFILSGEIAVSSDMQVVGAGARSTVIEQQSAGSRVLDIGSSTVAITGVTVRGGTADSSVDGNDGGNIRAFGSTVTVTASTITGGNAGIGGGIANNVGTLTVRNSTVAGNTAFVLQTVTAGAIANVGNSDNGATLVVDNSTVSGNMAGSGGAIVSGGHPSSSVTVRNSTIAGNSAFTGTLGTAGGIMIDEGTGSVAGSIVANNTSAAAATPNCSAGSSGTITSAGNNLESATDCGFTAAGDIRSRDPLLGALANNGGPTDTRSLSASSPARDEIPTGGPGCPGADQRGSPRPQGAGCDIGGFEATVFPVAVTSSASAVGIRSATLTGVGRPEGQATSYRFQFGETQAYGAEAPGAAGAVTAGSQFVVGAVSGLESNTTYHYRLVARSVVGTTAGADRTFTTAKKRLSDLPPPVLGKLVNVEPVSGEVTFATRGATAVARAAQKGLTFRPLREARQLPVGSFLNTRKGRVRLQSATTRRGRRQAGVFYSGLFQTLQSRRRSAKGLTELRLKGLSFRSCRTRGHGRRSSAARHSRRRVRRLRGNARGRFSTRGRHSAATVRGTVWEVQDRCDGTLTKVSRGRVAVRDFRRRKSILLRAGKSYLARARR